jgi:hypothetical protein
MASTLQTKHHKHLETRHDYQRKYGVVQNPTTTLADDVAATIAAFAPDRGESVAPRCSGGTGSADPSAPGGPLGRRPLARRLSNPEVLHSLKKLQDIRAGIWRQSWCRRSRRIYAAAGLAHSGR